MLRGTWVHGKACSYQIKNGLGNCCGTRNSWSHPNNCDIPPKETECHCQKLQVLPYINKLKYEILGTEFVLSSQSPSRNKPTPRINNNKNSSVTVCVFFIFLVPTSNPILKIFEPSNNYFVNLPMGPEIIPQSRVSDLLASLAHTGRVVFSHTLNTQTLTKTDGQKKDFK